MITVIKGNKYTKIILAERPRPMIESLLCYVVFKNVYGNERFKRKKIKIELRDNK